MTIALLCPTRARPEQFKRMCGSAVNTAQIQDYVKIYAGFTEGDETLSDYNGRHLFDECIYPDGMPTAFKWNLLAEEAMKDKNNKLFMLCADDTVFSTPLWDKALLDHYNALENKIHVYHLRDSRNPEGTPHPIVTREYIEAMGYFLPPIFLHWFVDTWTVEIAKSVGCFTHMKDYLLVHDKPSDKGQADETHNKIRNMGWRERDGWVEEKCRHFLEVEKKRLKEIIINNMSMEQRKRLGVKAW